MFFYLKNIELILIAELISFFSNLDLFKFYINFQFQVNYIIISVNIC